MNINKKRRDKVVILAIIFLSMICIIVEQSMYNSSLQNQINERNATIQELAFSDSLVHKYFNIEEDSIKSLKYYTLKDEYSSKETKTIVTNTVTQIQPEYVQIVDTITINSQNAQIEELSSRYNSLVDKYNKLVGSQNQLKREWQNINDSVRMTTMALGLIQRNFGIEYKGQISSGRISVEIHGEKADSAFMLFPFFRNKLYFNERKGQWEVKK